MFISSLGGIIDFDYSKTYIRDAGVWLAQHVPADESLYSNSEHVLYYSEHFNDRFFAVATHFSETDMVGTGEWKQYHYVALLVGHNDNNPIIALLTAQHVQPIQEFKNTRGDRVVIYKKRGTPF